MSRTARPVLAAIAAVLLTACGDSSAPRSPAPAPAPAPTPAAAEAMLPAYWFWTPATLEDEQWIEHARDLAKRGPYRIVFATPRYPMPSAGGIDFLDTDRFAPMFERAAAILAEGGVQLGVDLRCYLGLRGPVADRERQSLVTTHAVEFDAAGRATLDGARTDPAIFADAAPRLDVAFLRVAAQPAARGRFDGERLVLDGGRPGAATVLLEHRYEHADLYSDAYPRTFEAALRVYGQAGVRAAALDEFAFLPVRAERWRTTYHVSSGAKRAFLAQTGVELLDAIGRIARDPDGDGSRTLRLAYFRMQRQRISRVEQRFADIVAKSLGPDAFVGVHPTNQNLRDTEISLNALDWWSVPRRYGQSDEDTPMPIRLGLALKAGGPVWFHMFYDKSLDRMLDEVVECARYGGRVHYHAYADATFGVPLESPGLLERLDAIHRRLDPLDRLIDGVPELDTLVLIGWPWIVESAARGTGGAVGRTTAFTNRVHASGRRAAAVPTYEIVDGALTLRDGLAHYGGRTFRHVIAWHPTWSHPKTVDFLRSLRGSLEIVGEPTDENGEAIGFFDEHRPRRVESRDFVGRAHPSSRREVIRYPGNLAVVVDRKTLLDGGTATITVRHGGKEHRVSFTGAAVLRLTPNRPPEVLAPR